jgi:hypothetical protein
MTHLPNYTTQIPVQKTVTEIITLLQAHGASKIMQEFDEDREITAISFTLAVGPQHIPYRLPSQWPGAYWVMYPRAKAPRTWESRQEKAQRLKHEGQAKKTAWRTIFHWLVQQLGMVQMQQATPAQIFLPYQITDDGRTVYERLRDTQFALPPAQEMDAE